MVLLSPTISSRSGGGGRPATAAALAATAAALAATICALQPADPRDAGREAATSMANAKPSRPLATRVPAWCPNARSGSEETSDLYDQGAGRKWLVST